MIPFRRSRSTDYLNINDFSGGVNYSREKTFVNNNQLCDVENMWFKDGALKTRPALKCNVKGNYFYNDSASVKVNEMNSVSINNKRYFLETVKEDVAERTYIHLKLTSKTDKIELDCIDEIHFEGNYFAIVFKDDIYVFISGINTIYKVEKSAGGKYQKPVKIGNDEVYAPLVLTNCWPCFNDSGKINAMLLKGAKMAEGFNLLSDRYRIKFSQYDAKDYIEVNEGDATSRVSYMEYGLPYTTSNCHGTIYLEYTCISGYTHKHKVLCPEKGAPTVESESDMLNACDDLYLHAFVKGDVCHVSLNNKSESNNYYPAYIEVSKYINNNLEINAPREVSEKNWNRVAKMTETLWYGNNSLGINGGSRLFLGGNDDEKSLMVWSDFENPLYFPENNYAYVGDKSQKITAFARQGPNLIIFKEKEIYSTQYVIGELDSETADITTQSAYFPLALIHPNIGCINKNTIQLLRNRLVFMTDSGRICTLTEQNQYSERNVFNVSEMVDAKISDFENAVSADWQGFYLLFCKNDVFVMDYNTYGYVNIYTSNKESTANMHIPWFKWHIPVEIIAVVNDGGFINLWVKSNCNGAEYVHTLTLDEENASDEFFVSAEDDQILYSYKTTKKITSVIETKHFDFNAPNRFKTVEKVFVDMEKENDVTVALITDEKDKTWQSLSMHSIVPEKRIVKTLGIRIEGIGKIMLKAISIPYRLGNILK